jgi:hypothetical protein
MNEAALIRRWTDEGQGQLFESWRERPEAQRRRLLEDLETLEPDLVRSLAAELQAGPREPSRWIRCPRPVGGDAAMPARWASG